MTKPLYAASYQRGQRLVAAGCPLDYLEDLPRNLAAVRKTLEIRQLGGYVESRVVALGPTQTCYLLGLRLHTDLPRGIVISDWGFRPPWEDHVIFWDYEPTDILPALERGRYESVVHSRLSAVLNERRLLTRGHPVEGLLCGCASQTMPESLLSGATAYAMLTVTDDAGNTLALRIELTVDRSAALTGKARTTRREGGLFDKPDFVNRESEISEEQRMRRAAHKPPPFQIRREASG
jgi:hypothetical protein